LGPDDDFDSSALPFGAMERPRKTEKTVHEDVRPRSRPRPPVPEQPVQAERRGPDGRGEARAEVRPEARHAARADVRTDARTDARPDSRSGLSDAPAPGQDRGERSDWRSQEKRRGSGRRGGRRRRRGRGGGGPGEQHPGQPPRPLPGEPGSEPIDEFAVEPAAELETGTALLDPQREREAPRGFERPERPERNDRHERQGGGRGRGGRPQHGQHAQHPERRQQHPSGPAPSGAEVQALPREGTGMLVKEFGGIHVLRQLEQQYLQSRADIFVPDRLVHHIRLREGAVLSGRIGRGQKHKYALNDLLTVDGKDPLSLRNLADFKSLTSIDPDFHYAVGDASGEVAMRILDLLCPVGRGQRGLIVAPPRAGKTTILRQFAKGIEKGYPEVQLFVLLVDERPEEATEWRRATNGQVFVSTSDESAKTHVQLAEGVWKRCQRLVELGQDVVLLLDSITRLARAYNNLSGGSGRTMSGGLDAQAMQRPRAIFGSARNTEQAGSLTILGTTLVETGSKMDQLIFEEFKGTGNMELVLSRKLADRRIFPPSTSRSRARARTRSSTAPSATSRSRRCARCCCGSTSSRPWTSW
jgi:transcription termination factor Rho